MANNFFSLNYHYKKNWYYWWSKSVSNGQNLFC